MKGQLSSHTDTLQILIVDKIIFCYGTDSSTDTIPICLQKIKSSVYGFLCLTVATDTCFLKLSITRKHLAFQTEYTKHATLALRYSVNLS